MSWIQESAKNLQNLLSLIKNLDFDSESDEDTSYEYDYNDDSVQNNPDYDNYNSNYDYDNQQVQQTPHENKQNGQDFNVQNTNAQNSFDSSRLPVDFYDATERNDDSWMGNSIVGTSLATELRLVLR